MDPKSGFALLYSYIKFSEDGFHTAFNFLIRKIFAVNFIGGPSLPYSFVCFRIRHGDGAFLYRHSPVVISNQLRRIIHGEETPAVRIVKSTGKGTGVNRTALLHCCFLYQHIKVQQHIRIFFVTSYPCFSSSLSTTVLICCSVKELEFLAASFRSPASDQA